MIYNWRWFISKRLREAREEYKQVSKLLEAQRDLLKPQAIEEIESCLKKLNQESRGAINHETFKEAREELLKTAEQKLLAYPDAQYRDWIEMFLVVATLVLTFRAFFFQPFKIPTGSMQPTLYGITAIDLNKIESEQLKATARDGLLNIDGDFFSKNDTGRTISFKNGNSAIITKVNSSDEILIKPSLNASDQSFRLEPANKPNIKQKIINFFRGISHYSLKASGNWSLINIQPPKTIIPFISKQTIEFVDELGNSINKTIWFPPIRGTDPMLKMPGTYDPRSNRPFISKYEFEKGENVFNFQLKTGDHLFVNRMTYNFRKPKRGDISVFTISQDSIPSKSLNAPAKETFYIKRLVGLGGESIHLGTDHQLVVNNSRVDSTHRGFEFLYSFSKDLDTNGTNIWRIPRNAPTDSVYSGHLPMPGFHYGQTINVTPNHYLMFGDNSINSLDSRAWGELPQENVIGHSSFVYWPPLSPRFGWSHR
jgi:signal peptidase I